MFIMYLHTVCGTYTLKSVFALWLCMLNHGWHGNWLDTCYMADYVPRHELFLTVMVLLARSPEHRFRKTSSAESFDVHACVGPTPAHRNLSEERPPAARIATIAW